MGRLIEGLWDCPYCNTKGIGGSKRECPNCGRPRDENTKFYMPGTIQYIDEEKASKINKNPDWICSYCNSLNSDSDTICKSCGSERTTENLDYFSRDETSTKGARPRYDPPPTSTYEEDSYDDDKEFKESYTSSISSSNSSLSSSFFNGIWSKVLLGILSVAMIVGLIYLFVPKNEEVNISNIYWERSMDVEKYQTVNESDWTLPATARLHYAQEEFYQNVEVLDHYETKTRAVTKSVLDHYETQVTGYRDLGNGYFEEQTQQVPIYKDVTEYETYQDPVYRTEAVYKTKYYYEIDKWLYDRTLNSKGTVNAPYWPDTSSLTDIERVSKKTENYYIVGTNKKGKEKKYSLTFDDFNTLSIGDTVKLKVTVIGTATLIKDE